MRRLTALALAVPYAVIMWPSWIARDFVAAFQSGWRHSDADARRAE